MRHMRKITVTKAEAAKADAMEDLFFQFFFTILSIMFAAAFGKEF